MLLYTGKKQAPLYRFFIILFATLSLDSALTAENSITIYNRSDHTFFITSYYTYDTSISRATAITPIGSYKQVTIQAPPFQLSSNRYLLLAEKKDDLHNRLSSDLFTTLCKKKIGIFSDNVFYISVDAHTQTTALNTKKEWEALLIKMHTRKIFESKYSHYGVKATLETKASYWKHERDFLNHRRPILRQGLSKMLATKSTAEKSFLSTFKYTPKIALCFSGGGFRAMLATLGFLAGAEKTGLLAASSYSATLSGSAWAQSIILRAQGNTQQARNRITDGLSNGIIGFNKNVRDALTSIKRLKSAFDLPNDSIDLYGTFISHTILSLWNDTRPYKSSFDITLADLEGSMAPHITPYPLMTAVYSPLKNSYQWLEFNPLEVKSTYLQAAIPTWALGRYFDRGSSSAFGPQPSLGYLMGIFGSAFCLSMNRILEYAAENIPFLPLWLSKFISKIIMIDAQWADSHILSGHIPNPTYNCSWSSESTTKILPLIDAGYATNIPLEPLLQKERHVDIIIVFDMSHWAKSYVMKGAEERAKAQGLKMPPINYTLLEKNGFNVFYNEHDVDCPVIIHIGLKKHQEYHPTFDPLKADYCSTYNFTYSPGQCQELMGLSEFIAKKYHDDIVHVVRMVIKRKVPH